MYVWLDKPVVYDLHGPFPTTLVARIGLVNLVAINSNILKFKKEK